jgi:DNA-binding NarL/FixJ family response regulator
MENTMIKIIITEDNDVIREGLGVLINATEGLECCAMYTNCEDMLADYKNHQVDIFLQDIGLPGMSGIEGVKILRSEKPEAVVLMLTVYEDEENVFEALKAGASGYLLKKTPPDQLIDAIKDANQGGSPMSSNIARKVVRFFSNNTSHNQQYDLSNREKQILNGLSTGNSYQMLADDLFISIHTVRSHIRKIYKKLHVHNQSEAVAIAYKEGII